MECATQGDAAADCGPLAAVWIQNRYPPYKCHPSQMSTQISRIRITPLLKTSENKVFVTWIVSMVWIFPASNSQQLASKAAMSKQGCKVQSAYRLQQQKGRRFEQYFRGKLSLIICNSIVIRYIYIYLHIHTIHYISTYTQHIKIYRHTYNTYLYIYTQCISIYTIYLHTQHTYIYIYISQCLT